MLLGVSARCEVAHPAGAHDDAMAAARDFAALLRKVDRAARREWRTIPTEAERQAIRDAFLNELAPRLRSAEARLEDDGVWAAQREVMTILSPWMLRSGFWARCIVKPHGYAGDYRTLEVLYDLELSECADPAQPAVVNALDGLARSVAGVRAVWERRRWFAELIERELMCRDDGTLRVLDVACGGSRYLRDVLGRVRPLSIEATFLDQDATALTFVRSWLPAPALARATFLGGSARRLQRLVGTEAQSRRSGYDVVIATGLFDYLGDAAARALLADMVSVARPGATVMICNFTPDSESRVIKEWVCDWRLVYRTRDQLASLFPRDMHPVVRCSARGGLLFASAVVRP